jgi:Tat protein secretion system quality control protein TatD with DNase activity
MLAFIAEAKGWSAEEAARVTRENAMRFYGGVSE